MSHVEVGCEQIQEFQRLMHNMEEKSVLDHLALLKAAMYMNVQVPMKISKYKFSI